MLPWNPSISCYLIKTLLIVILLYLEAPSTIYITYKLLWLIVPIYNYECLAHSFLNISNPGGAGEGSWNKREDRKSERVKYIGFRENSCFLLQTKIAFSSSKQEQPY